MGSNWTPEHRARKRSLAHKLLKAAEAAEYTDEQFDAVLRYNGYTRKSPVRMTEWRMRRDNDPMWSPLAKVETLMGATAQVKAEKPKALRSREVSVPRQANVFRAALDVSSLSDDDLTMLVGMASAELVRRLS